MATHLLVQNTRAQEYGDACAYRGDFGRKRAIGCLMPDELYVDELEGRPIDDVRGVWPQDWRPTVEHLVPGHRQSQ